MLMYLLYWNCCLGVDKSVLVVVSPGIIHSLSPYQSVFSQSIVLIFVKLKRAGANKKYVQKETNEHKLNIRDPLTN